MSASLTDPAAAAPAPAVAPDPAPVPATAVLAPTELQEVPPLTYPITVSVGGASVTLHANGVVEADVKALEGALTTARGIEPATSLVLWLLLKVLKP